MKNNSMTVLGAGTWGITLAKVLADQGYDVTVWSPIQKEIDQLNATHIHPNLSYVTLPDHLQYTSNIEEACKDAKMITIAVPSIFMRSTIKQASKFIHKEQIIVTVTKGIEESTLFTMSEVIQDELNQNEEHPYNYKIVALSGPTHAEEVIREVPTSIVAASTDLEIAKEVQSIYSCSYFRVYTNFDILGVELCGAIKNIIALTCGIAEGLGLGDNTKAALMTRGINEMTKLGLAMGCTSQTFLGLTSVGDTVVTAFSKHSRNNRCGNLIGQGYTVQEAVKEVGMVVEGLNALPAAKRLQEKYEIEMPIIETVYQMVNQGLTAKEALSHLMSRSLKSELLDSELNISFEDAILRNRKRSKASRVITYGTFDLLHYGHINLLRRAKALGDYLIVALSTDEFNGLKGKTAYFSYEQRKALLEAIRYVDLVIPEESWEQKKSDIHEFYIDTVVMGADWTGRFDDLKEEGVEVVYLPRTPEISTTQIKEDLEQ